MRTMEIVEGMERGAVSGSKFLSQLVKTYSNKALYLSLFDEIKAFAEKKGLSEKAMELFEKHSPHGVIYVIVGENFERLNRDLAIHLLDVLRDEVAGQSNGSEKKWRELLKRYEASMLKSYENFLKLDGRGSAVFEASCRHLFRDAARTWWGEAPSQAREVRGELTKRFSKELNGLFHHLRERVSTTLRFDDSLVAESFGKALILPGPLPDLNLQVLESSIEEMGLTLSLLEKVDRVVSASLRERDEREIVERFREATMTTKADIEKLLPARAIDISAEGLTILKGILSEKGEELKRRAFQEFEETNKVIQSNQKRFAEGMEGLLNGIRSLTYRVSSAESFASLSGEITERVESLERFSERSLWSLKELKRREDELKRAVGRGEVLANLTGEEVDELLKKGGKSRGAMHRLYDTYQGFGDGGGEGMRGLDSKAKTELRRAVSEEERSCRETEKMNLLGGLIRRRILIKRYDLDELMKRYLATMSEIIEPLVISKKIGEMVRVWPPRVEASERLEGSPLLEEARYVGEILAPNGLLYQLSCGEDVPFDFLAPSKGRDLGRMVRDNCSEVVSLLVYDIRGSTFMGKKLRNAQTESEIRNLFNKRMVDLGRRFGGFPLKDTGDGGIIFFSGNSDELYRDSYLSRGEEESGIVRQAVPLRESRSVIASPQSAERAIRCAIGFVAEAQRFVQENLVRYGNWFKDVEEKTLLYEGITYAKLPPEYKRIFRIGIGIASGIPDKDLFFGLNSFGDSDVTGNLVRDANLYSKGKAEEGSVILCDGPTVLNFLLNVEEFEPYSPKKTEIESLAPGKGGGRLREEVKRWWELSRRIGEYLVSSLGAVIRRIGYRAVLGEELPEGPQLSVEARGVRIDEYGEIRDEKGREVKVLYQVIPQERSWERSIESRDTEGTQS